MFVNGVSIVFLNEVALFISRFKLVKETHGHHIVVVDRKK